MCFTLCSDRRFERRRQSSRLDQQLNFSNRKVQPDSQLARRRIATEFGRQSPPLVHEAIQRIEDVDREADGPAVICNPARDRLADPPRGVCRELESSTELEPIDRL